MQIPIFTIGCVIIGGVFFMKLFPVIVEVKAIPLAKGAGALVGAVLGARVGLRLDGIEIEPLLGVILLYVPALLVLVAVIFPATGRRLGLEEEEDL